MKGVKVKLRDAQKAKEILNSSKLLAPYRIIKEREYIIFPVKIFLKSKK